MTLADLNGKLCELHHALITVREIAPGRPLATCAKDCGPLEIKAQLDKVNAAGVAQQEEQRTRNAQGAGSNPATGSKPKPADVFGTEPDPKQRREEEQEEERLKEEAPPHEDSRIRQEHSRQQQRRDEQSGQKDWRGRVPPHNLDAEMGLLGSILLNSAVIETALPIVSPEHFYRESHRKIFSAMIALNRSNTPIDVITLALALGGKDKLALVGGARYLADLAAYVPTPAHAKIYAEIIRDMAIKREIAEKAFQLIEYSYNGVTADALVGEMQRMLTPIGDSLGPQLPELISRNIEVVSGADFYTEQTALPPRSWLVDGLIARKEISLWSGKVEAGKTTAMRTLVMCQLRGDPFLDRATYPGKVLYVMLDADGRDTTFEEFQRLGLDFQQEEIDFLIDPVMCLRPNSFAQFHAKLLELKPSLVVIDPLGRFERQDDVLSYGMTYAMARFSELAKLTDCHMALIHHIPRGRGDNDDPATAGFGSVAIAGGCNARFVFIHKMGDVYTFKSSKGKGGGFRAFDGEQTLARDPDTGWITLRGAYSFKDQARAIRDQVLQIINSAEGEVTSSAIGRELKVARSVAGLAAKMLADDGLCVFRREGQRYLFSALPGTQRDLV